MILFEEEKNAVFQYVTFFDWSVYAEVEKKIPQDLCWLKDIFNHVFEQPID